MVLETISLAAPENRERTGAMVGGCWFENAAELPPRVFTIILVLILVLLALLLLPHALRVVVAHITLDAPTEIVAGLPVTVNLTGPNQWRCSKPASPYQAINADHLPRRAVWTSPRNRSHALTTKLNSKQYMLRQCPEDQGRLPASAWRSNAASG